MLTVLHTPGTSVTDPVHFRKLKTIGPDDIAAVASVGEAGLHAVSALVDCHVLA